ncbi:uncharacterized protein JCM10292_000681 [Rhodotorula paludigena]|uniref:uncharacterized protein n=1 Tax=Rhodotorula paludigena TaxID=86838 RepID=UPI003170E7ED
MSNTTANTSPTVYVVTGANRGIGLAIAATLAEREHALVFAAVRDPAKADALKALAKETGRIELLQYESPSEDSAKALAQAIEEKAGKVDVVISNAGTQTDYEPITTVASHHLTTSFNVNVVGPVTLFQAVLPLLRKSAAPQFVGISSIAASNTIAVPFATDSYIISKAALNSAVKRVHTFHAEQDNIAAYTLHPGAVITDMATAWMDYAPELKFPPEMIVSVEDSANAIVRLVEGATREKTGGRFWNAVDGTELPW